MNYYSKKFLQEENSYFKKNGWILICHKNNLPNKNTFLTFNIFGEPVIIFNFGSEIKAFTNVCPHRGSKIKTNQSGSGIFKCDYHGWCFNKYGGLISGPHLDVAFKNLKKNSIKLTKWNIDQCGNFVFLSSSKNKIKLKSYLGKNYLKIENLSKNYYEHISTKTYLWKCNWKIAIENSIDEYHGPILHQNTFKRVLKLDPFYNFDKNVSTMEMPLNEKYLFNFKKIKNIFNQNLLNNNYRHDMIWPVSTMASTMGAFNFLQQYLPVDEKTTKIYTSIFLNKIASEKNNLAIKNFLSDSAKAFNEEVFAEDKEVCEEIQNNVDNKKQFSKFGIFEIRIKKFRQKIQQIANRDAK